MQDTNDVLCTCAGTLATPVQPPCYTSTMAKKITLDTLAAQLSKMDARVERGFEAVDTKFAALADDISDIKHEKATKDQLVAIHGQVNAIETQLRDMRPVKLHSRVADLEEKVFGEARS